MTRGSSRPRPSVKPSGTRPPRSGSPASQHLSIPLYRWAHLLILITLLVGNLIQRPGYTTFDTKLDLVENPGYFMSRALTVWNPSMDMGSLQNQAYGYFFPVGPFFWIGDAIGAPMWIWQRLWSALIMIAAYEGMRRLARASGGIGPGAAVVAGLAFALAPRMMTVAGVLTMEALPGVVLPWTVLPLVHAWHGRWSWRRAVVMSAATLPFMSGVNATEVICTLPLPGLVIVCSPQTWRGRITWGAVWSGLVLLVCAWWIGPLLVLGRYAPPFLDYIESAAATTGPLGWLTVLRGTTHWATFLSVSESHWIAGHQLTFQPVLVVLATVLGVLGLMALAALRTPLRLPYLLACVLGLLLMALGHGGAGGSILSDGMRAFLDAGGAPFRNIHKFDPIVRVGMSIGMGALVTWAVQRVYHAPDGSRRARRPMLAHAPAALALLLVSTMATPAFQGNLRADDGYREFPQPLRQMQQTLEALPDASRVLVLPGPGFVDHTWGRTVDEPVQTMVGVNWASRTQIPIVSAGGLRLLESIEEFTSAGRPSNALAPMLAQAGFTHVLVRNDLNPATTDVPSNARLHATLRSSPGLREQQSYGVGDDGFPMLELYALTGVVPRARAVQAAGIRELAGESDYLLGLGAAGVLAPDELTITRGSGLPVRGRVLTEGAEKRSRSFGRVHDALSGVRGATQPWDTKRAAHDYAAIDTQRLTTVDYGPVASIRTSTSADDTDIFGPVRRDRGAWAAFDGNLETSFRTAPFTNAVGQWMHLKLARRQPIGDIAVTLDLAGAAVTSLKITTDQGTRTVRVPRDGTVRVNDLGGSTDDIRFEVTGVREGPQQVRIANVAFSRLKPTRTQLVDAPADSSTTLSFRSWPGRPACVAAPRGVRCETVSAMDVEEAGGFSRTVTFREGGQWTVSGLARVTSGRVVDDLLLPLGEGVAVRASSSFGGEPLATAARAVDDDDGTAWASGTSDPSPWLDLSWKSSRTIQTIRLNSSVRMPGSPAQVVGVAVNGKPTAFRRTQRGWQLDRPVPATSIRLQLAAPAKGSQVAVGEVVVSGLEGLAYRARASDVTGQPCGFGPPITVAGRTVQTRISGTIGDVQDGRLLRVESCGEPVSISPGRVTISTTAVSGFIPTGVTLTPRNQRPAAIRDLPLSISSWSDEKRRIAIGGSDTALLALPENINDGWVATLDGKRLSAVTVDGWKQGFVVPAGQARTVELTYQPGRPYRLSLLFGGLAALATMAMGAFLLVTGRGRRTASPTPVTAEGAQPATLHGGASWWRQRPGVWLSVLTALLAIFAALPVAAGFVAAALTPARWRRRLRVGLVLVAAAAAAWWATRVGSDAVTAPVDVVVGAVIGALLGQGMAPLPVRRIPKRKVAPSV